MFQCEEEALEPNKLCIFHDENYIRSKTIDCQKEHNKKIIERLMEIVDNSTSNKAVLKCIGYHLPKIKISKKFDRPVYFNKSKFYGAADFSKSEFSANVGFYKTIFYDKVMFKEVVFSNLVTFRESIFLNEADFRETSFNGRANFDLTFFDQVDFYHSTFNGMAYFRKSTFAVFAGFRKVTFSNDLDFGEAGLFCETIFTDCKFSNNVIFYRTIFSGHMKFLRTRFLDIVNFRGCLFSGDIIFDISKFSGEVLFIESTFSGKVEFTQSIFSSEVSFGAAKFSGLVNFLRSKFSVGAFFSDVNFGGRTNFNHVLFENGERILFDVKNMANVSFLYTDISKVRFSENISWGTTSDDKFKLRDEEKIEWSLRCLFNWNVFPNSKDIESKDMEKLKDFLKWVGYPGNIKDLSFKKDGSNTITICRKIDDYPMIEATIKLNSDKTIARMTNGYNFFYSFMAKEENGTINIYGNRRDLGNVKAVYRNLRENYEYRLRYDEAGEFFKREMELKRKYREVVSEDGSIVVKQNGRLRSNFSLTGLYYRLSRYGEDLLRPTLIGIVVVFLSTLFWIIQNNPTAEPSLSFIASKKLHNFINITQIWNNTHSLKAFERSFADFLPLLPQGSNVKVGLFDYIVKILGGTLTFAFLAIALRRKFERRFRH